LTNGTKGSLTVPSDESGAPCILDNATVKGSVTVQPGGDLTIRNATHITGSVIADHAEQVNIHGRHNTIDGALTMTGSSSEATTSQICSVTIGGSLNVSQIAERPNGSGSDGVEIDGDSGECPFAPVFVPLTVGGSVNLQNNVEEVELSQAKVSGSVNVISNSDGDPEGSAEIEGNGIGGTLACSGNVNGIDNGGETNTVKTKTGQCVGL
jgi:hypothetical protein